MTDYKDGDTITVNGKPCRIEGGALVPVVKRGPLGGEFVCVEEIEEGKEFYLRGHIKNSTRDVYKLAYVGADGFEYAAELHHCITVETNIPPRPTFTPMTAGEAAKLPDIVGRWVAVRACNKSSDELVLGDEIYERWFDRDDQILLIEGVDL